jgi:hypothetical protein
MDAFQSDLWYAVRSLRKSRTFAAAAILMLALGIGANTAVFSLVDAILLKRLPYQDAERIVMLVNTWSNNSSPIESSTRFETLRRRPSFDVTAAYRVVGINASTRGEPVQLLSLQVTEDFFRLFGASVGPGRGFRSDDFLASAADVVVLTRGVWQQRFGGDPALIGTTVDIGNRPFTVIGVSSGDFDADTLPYAVRPDVFVPLRYDVTAQTVTHYLVGAARLKPGTSLAAARADPPCGNGRSRFERRLAQVEASLSETRRCGFTCSPKRSRRSKKTPRQSAWDPWAAASSQRRLSDCYWQTVTHFSVKRQIGRPTRAGRLRWPT